MRFSGLLLLSSLVGSIGLLPAEAKEPAAEEIPTALQDYVATKDDAYAWKILNKDQSDGALVYDIDLTSQEWQGITWKHALTVFVPEKCLCCDD